MSKDALAAAPATHKLIFENDQVRVLDLEILPGQKEEPHTHQWHGVVVVKSPAKLKYVPADGEPAIEEYMEGAVWREALPMHYFENIDTKPFRAFRIELKK